MYHFWLLVDDGIHFIFYFPRFDRPQMPNALYVESFKQVADSVHKLDCKKSITTYK